MFGEIKMFKNIPCSAYFAKDVEDCFGYGKLNVFVIQVPCIQMVKF